MKDKHMSLTELRDIVKQGQTAKYNIKEGDFFPLDAYNYNGFYVITIGDNYITCICPRTFWGSYYSQSQINKERPEAIVGYPNSNLRKNVYCWYAEQSDEFKSVIKDTKITYERFLLSTNYDRYGEKKLTQGFYDFEELIEKVFIPSKEDYHKIYNMRDIFLEPAYYGFEQELITSTPCSFSAAFPGMSYGMFCKGKTGEIVRDFGMNSPNCCIMFNIG